MKAKCLAWCSSPNLGLFILRLGVGVIFLSHGLSKLSNMEGTIGFFASLGLGAFMAWVVAIIETVGGAALIIGLWTRFFGVALAAIMVGVFFTAKWGKPLASSEFEALLLAASLAITFIGAGKFSFSKKCAECKECDCLCHGDEERCGDDQICAGCKCS